MPDTVRERIIETACRLFYSQGYNRTGINQIIKEAQVAKASLYQHFASKDELCVTYLRRRHQRWFDELYPFVEQGKTPEERLELTFRYLREWLAREDYTGCSFSNILAENPQDRDLILAEVRSYNREMRLHFQNIARALQLPDSDQMADRLMLLFDGAISQSRILKNEEPIQTAKQTALSLLRFHLDYTKINRD